MERSSRGRRWENWLMELVWRNWFHVKSVNLGPEDLRSSPDTESAEAASLPEPWWAPTLEG